MRATITIFISIGFAPLLEPGAARGIEPCEVARLTGDPVSGGGFGAGLGVSGDYIVAGDPSDSTMGSLAGAAYIFHRIGTAWVQDAKIFGSGTDFEDSFGLSAAVQGDRVVVGAPHFDPLGSQWWGYAFVFQRVNGTWVEKQKLISSESALDDRFGWSVAISGDWIAVGATWQDGYFGRVFLFRWDGNSYVEQTSVVGSDTVQFNEFGKVIALRDDRLLVGVRSTNAGRGKAYVFRREGNNWLEEAQLTASDGAPGDHFGEVVSLSGEFAIVGAPATDHAGSNAGSAYIFRRMGTIWTEQAILWGSSPQTTANFGETVGIYGPHALVGAPGHNSGTVENVGATFLFKNVQGTWTEVGNFDPAKSHAWLVFGSSSIGFDGVHAVIGASFSAYVYAVPNGPPCIPAMSVSGFCILAGVLLISGIALLKRGKPLYAL